MGRARSAALLYTAAEEAPVERAEKNRVERAVKNPGVLMAPCRLPALPDTRDWKKQRVIKVSRFLDYHDPVNTNQTDRRLCSPLISLASCKVAG